MILKNCTGEFGCDCPDRRVEKKWAEKRHGTRKKYQMGCRCPLCSEANAAYHRKYRKAVKERNGAA